MSVARGHPPAPGQSPGASGQVAAFPANKQLPLPVGPRGSRAVASPNPESALRKCKSRGDSHLPPAPNTTVAASFGLLVWVRHSPACVTPPRPPAGAAVTSWLRRPAPPAWSSAGATRREACAHTISRNRKDPVSTDGWAGLTSGLSVAGGRQPSHCVTTAARCLFQRWL